MSVNSFSDQVGAAKQFKAIATYQSGATQDVSAQAQWAVEDPAAGSVSDGLLTPTAAVGAVVKVTAAFGGATGEADVTMTDTVTDVSIQEA